MQSVQPMQETDENIKLKETVLQIKSIVNHLKTKWLVILLAGVIGGISGFVYAFLKEPGYVATLSFVVGDPKASGGGLASVSGLASQFGIDIGGSSNGGAFAGENLLELMKSRTLVEKALLNPVTVDNKTISLADFYIDVYELREKWEKNKNLRSIYFPVKNDLDQLSKFQNEALASIYGQIISKNLRVDQKNKRVSIIDLTVTSKNDSFSKTFVEAVERVVSEFYIETRTKRATRNMAILQTQVDSVRQKLSESISGVAAANDETFGLNPALNIKKVPSSKRQIDVQANTAILSQLLQNLEIAKMSLLQETPLIQVLDKPVFPLPVEQAGRFKFLLVGFFLFFIAAMGIVIIVNWWKGLMMGL